MDRSRESRAVVWVLCACVGLACSVKESPAPAGAADADKTVPAVAGEAEETAPDVGEVGRAAGVAEGEETAIAKPGAEREASAAAKVDPRKYRRLPVKEYVGKMKAGWIGQMAGVGLGAPTEFKFKGEIIPEDRMPTWHPGRINQFGQDDIYVEMTFLRTLELHGLDVSIRICGIDFANSRYNLWHANRFGRQNLRSGIAPPDSGHPQFSKHADDIDYQIEADFSGLIAPGLPNVVIELGEKFGRLMNYGDGVYGGQLVGGMYAEAFFEDDPVKIVEAGMKCIPKGSQYYECIADVLKWYRENPGDWQKTWQLIEQKYQDNPAYRRYSCNKGDLNIDAKINGAYIVIGLLYGKGDLDQTTIISCRCGQDSDCNPSNAAGVLFTTLEYSALPERFTSALSDQRTFSHTPYTFPKLVEVCTELARQAVVRAGGRIEKDAEGEDVLVIPVEDPRPSKLEQCWEPGPPANSRFTAEEMAQITEDTSMRGAVKRFAPGWKVSKCGEAMEPGLRDEWGGRKNVLVTHPYNEETGCVLTRKVDVPAGKQTTLRLVVTHDPNGDWLLIVKANGEKLLERTVSKETAPGGWMEVSVDLSRFAGRKVKLELVNQANGWAWEAAYWAEIAVESE